MIGRMLCCLLGAVILSGCGASGPELAEVEGVVTFNGVAVPNTAITFVPQDVKNASASYGSTDIDGKFVLLFSESRKGAFIGKHLVTLTPGTLTADDIAMREKFNSPIPKMVKLPKKLCEPGAHSAEVKSGKNVINFALTDN